MNSSTMRGRFKTSENRCGGTVMIMAVALWGCSGSTKRESNRSGLASAEEAKKAEEIATKAEKAKKTYKVSLKAATKYYQSVADTQEANLEMDSVQIKLSSKSGSPVLGHVTVVERAKGGVIINYLISGLTAGQEHGFHIHDKGDCSAEDGSSAGPHWNPDNKPHGDRTAGDHHAGDLGNVKADDKGVAVVPKVNALVLKGIELSDLDGKALIVHEKPDDFKTENTGNAGARWACGEIKVKSKSKKDE